MRFVATKTLEQQSCLMLHRTRHLFIRQQTAVISAIRAHLAEFGIVAPIGRNGVEQLLDVVADTSNKRLPNIFIRVLHFEPIGRAPRAINRVSQPAMPLRPVGQGCAPEATLVAATRWRASRVGGNGRPP